MLAFHLRRLHRRLLSRNLNSKVAGERAFDESLTTIKLTDDDGGGDDRGTFVCDEEPHMLTPELGYGYYPLTLRERIAGDKYEIVRKLGWGQNSSVWLASVCNEPHPTYAAIKILTVNATAGILKKRSDEFELFKRVTDTNKGHPGYPHCLTLRGKFLARSKHGPHICMVTDVLGSNMVDLRRSQPKGVFGISTTKRIIKQTLQALHYLHNECHIVHTDVKPDNILVSQDNQDTAIHAFLAENPSATYEPRLERELSPDPIITVKTQPLPDFCLDPTLSNLNIRLIDYGSAVSADSILQGEAQPALLRAPEVILGHTWSFPVDIWSVGCLVFEYLISKSLFQLHESSSVSFTDTHLQRILEHIGLFPAHFLAACSRRAEYFNEQGSLLRVQAQELLPRSIDECLRHYRLVDEAQIVSAATFIRRCLTIDPNARPSALELLNDGWLRDV